MSIILITFQINKIKLVISFYVYFKNNNFYKFVLFFVLIFVFFLLTLYVYMAYKG